uniref:Dynein regulatory complex subunit 4 n=1 Tax=Clastoptera arizonana TaxID=38151 RepID=A0A1B6D8X8_9HEMI
MEIKVYKQKVKHLIYEQQNNLTELKAENMVTLKMEESDHTKQELELYKDKMILKETIVRLNLAHQEDIKSLHLGHSKELSQLRSQFGEKYDNLERKIDKRLAALRNQLGLKHRIELTEVEERKNNQISLLVNNHQQAFTDLKSYYNDITLNNLALITSLKEQLEEVKRNEDKMDKKLKEVMIENKKITLPLKVALEQVTEFQKQLANYEKDKITLCNMKKHLSVVTKQLEEKTAKNDILELTLEKVKSERDELHDRFVSSIMDLQQKCSLKNLILEKKLSALNIALEERDAQIAEVMVTTNLDPKLTSISNRKLEDLLGSKNSQIQELQIEIARLSKLHDDMIQKWKCKLDLLGVPTEDLNDTCLVVKRQR